MAISINRPPSLGGLMQSQQAQQLALARLASGQRINKAADDPAGLVIAEQLDTYANGLEQAGRNTEIGIAMAQTADGGLEQTMSIIQQQRELALQAANTGTMDENQLSALNAQFHALGKSLDMVAANTSFAGRPLLDGSYRNQTLQLGASAGDTVQVDIASRITGQPAGFGAQGLGLAGLDLSNPEDVLARLDAAGEAVLQQRGALGALQANTLETNASSLSVARENLLSAVSTIRDTDYAKDASDLVGSQIRHQAGLAMLAQGNQHTSRVLQLLS
jgi:flagellin